MPLTVVWWGCATEKVVARHKKVLRRNPEGDKFCVSELVPWESVWIEKKGSGGKKDANVAEGIGKKGREQRKGKQGTWMIRKQEIG